MTGALRDAAQNIATNVSANETTLAFPFRSLLGIAIRYQPLKVGLQTSGDVYVRIEDLQIGRVVMHEVLKRDQDRVAKEPIFGTSLERLPAQALLAFRMRVTDALSTQSKSIEMRLIELGDESLVGIAERLQNSDDATFLSTSKEVAKKLASAQKVRGVPGGVVIVFEGTFSVPPRKFVGVIKAETHTGFRRNKLSASVITEFLSDIFLTPAQRLYKIAFLVAGDAKDGRSGWSAFVFDNNINSNHRESAAQYFYEGFMGATFAENGAYETQRFFDLTKDFVRTTGLTPSEKRDLGDALYTFLKTDKAATFTAEEFAKGYFPVEILDPFVRHMEANKFPTRAVVRDTTKMGNRLRRRRFRFGSDVEVNVSPEALHDKTVAIVPIDAASEGGAEGAKWTKIIIQRQMTDQI